MNPKICDGWGELPAPEDDGLSIPFFMKRSYHDFCGEVIERQKHAEWQRKVKHKRRSASLKRRCNKERMIAFLTIMMALILFAGKLS